MNRNSFLLVVFLCAVSFGSSRFLLESELRTDYNGTATNNFLTAYTYDAQGNRLLTRVWDGLDSLAAPISKSVYSYNIDGHVDQEVLLSQIGDTLSMVRYTYSGNLLAMVKILRKDGSLRYSDSMLYGQNGYLTEMRRYNSALAMTFYHRYAYDASGRKLADSLYEPSNPSTYAPTQAVIVAYNTDGTVGAEASWRISGSQQYLISTVKFGYSSQMLVSAATYEGDGTGNRLMDSLAYAYDNFGNRSQETKFDNERVKNYQIVYTWHDTQATGLMMSAARNAPGRIISAQGRSIVFRQPFTGSATVYSINGKAIAANTLVHAVHYDLPNSLRTGRYVVTLACGNTITGHQITISR